MSNGTVFSVDSVNFRGLESYMDQERESTGLRFLINLVSPAMCFKIRQRRKKIWVWCMGNLGGCSGFGPTGRKSGSANGWNIFLFGWRGCRTASLSTNRLPCECPLSYVRIHMHFPPITALYECEGNNGSVSGNFPTPITTRNKMNTAHEKEMQDNKTRTPYKTNGMLLERQLNKCHVGEP